MCQGPSRRSCGALLVSGRGRSSGPPGDGPGHLDLAVGDVVLESLALAFGEVLDAGEQGPENLVQRVVLMTAQPQCLVGERDDVPRVQHRERPRRTIRHALLTHRKACYP